MFIWVEAPFFVFFAAFFDVFWPLLFFVCLGSLVAVAPRVCNYFLVVQVLKLTSSSFVLLRYE